MMNCHGPHNATWILYVCGPGPQIKIDKLYIEGTHNEKINLRKFYEVLMMRRLIIYRGHHNKEINCMQFS